jgi:hypothetical protein
MKRTYTKTVDYLHSLLNVRAMILSVSLLHLIVTLVWISRWYEKFGDGPISFYPDVFLVVPLALFVASLMLFISRWWTHLLASVVSGWVIYSLGYAGLRAVSIGRDVPLLSSESLWVWFAQKHIGQFLELALALVILCYVFYTLLRKRRRDITETTISNA